MAGSNSLQQDSNLVVWDYLVIGVYFVSILVIGLVVRHAMQVFLRASHHEFVFNPIQSTIKGERSGSVGEHFLAARSMHFIPVWHIFLKDNQM